MAEHYGTVIVPARIKKPRDKAKVEVGVQIAERQILAALRDQRFFNVGQLNAAICPLLTKLNEQPFQKLDGSRNSWFETLEKGQLLPLPAMAFELANWSKAKVNIDYHVAVEKHFYSAPYQLIHQQLDVRLTDKTVELFAHGKRVAAHLRSYRAGRSTTLEEHRPKSHQRYLQWTPSRILEWVKTIGPDCVKVVEKIMAFALPWGSSAWAKLSAMTAWKPLAGAPCTLAPVPIPASSPFSKTTWKPNPWSRNYPCPARTTKISGAVLTTANPKPTLCCLPKRWKNFTPCDWRDW
jgi:hypothetical protein